MKKTKYNVVYTWQGERHRLLVDFVTRHEAGKAVAEMRAKGFNAWIETL
jgi:phage-related protein